MARPKMITRTVKYTVATFMTLDINTAEPSNVVFKLPGLYKTEKGMLDAVAPLLPENIRAVAVVDQAIDEKLLGIPESVFLEHACEIAKPAKHEEV